MYACIIETESERERERETQSELCRVMQLYSCIVTHLSLYVTPVQVPRTLLTTTSYGL